MRRAAREDILEVAGKAFFEEGYLQLSIPALVQRAGISESTLRRMFTRGKASIFRAVLERAAEKVFQNYLAFLEQRQLDQKTSNPIDLVLCYFDCVMSMWGDSPERSWSVGLLFGYDGSASGTDDLGADFVSPQMMSDINLLDEILGRACEGEPAKAKNLSCMVLGAIREFVTSELDVQAGYRRGYTREGVAELIRQLMRGAISSRDYSITSNENSSISISELSRAAQKLKQLATEQQDLAQQIDRLLDAHKQSSRLPG